MEVNLNIRIEKEFRNRIKSMVAARGITLKELLTGLILEWMREAERNEK